MKIIILCFILLTLLCSCSQLKNSIPQDGRVNFNLGDQTVLSVTPTQVIYHDKVITSDAQIVKALYETTRAILESRCLKSCDELKATPPTEVKK